MQNREKYVPKKKKITQDNIYMVRQFAYIHEVVVISIFSGKNIRCSNIVFFLKTTHQTLISKTKVFTILHTEFIEFFYYLEIRKYYKSAMVFKLRRE